MSKKILWMSNANVRNWMLKTIKCRRKLTDVGTGTASALRIGRLKKGHRVKTERGDKTTIDEKRRSTLVRFLGYETTPVRFLEEEEDCLKPRLLGF
jgi:hypothetical protein